MVMVELDFGVWLAIGLVLISIGMLMGYTFRDVGRNKKDVSNG